MKKILFAATLLFFGLYASAQTNITGVLTDGEESLPMATVMLHSMPDTIYIKGVSTDDNGNFTIKDVAKGTYMIKISYIGYDDFSKKIYIDGNTKEFKLGNIVLKSGIMLQGASVVGKATAVTIKGDTIEYNPNAYKLQDNAVIEDLLKKLPGVQVDKDGTVTAGGKEVTKVLLGGKEFFANDPTLATKNVPVKIVEKVQVLERKSEQERLTGISDGEEETVINLEIKKGQQQGWMGNLNSGLGSDIKNEAGNKLRFDESAFVNRLTTNSRFTLISNFNNTNTGRGGRNTFGGTSGNTTAGMGGLDIASYATDKLTVEGNGYFTYRNTNVESSSNTETFLKNSAQQDSSFYRNSSSSSDTYNRNYSSNVRFTYKPNDYNTIIFRPQGSHSHSDSYRTSSSETFGGDFDTVNTNVQHSRTESKTLSYGAELDYSHKFGTTGRNLSFELQYSGSDTKGFTKSDSRTRYVKSDSILNLDQLSNNKSNSITYRLQASYIEPLSKNDFLQFRYSYSANNRDQETDTYNNDGSGNYTDFDSIYSNSYENKYINQQIHLSYKRTADKYNFQVGVNVNPQSSQSIRTRYENGQELQIEQERNVTNFGPMAQFQYNFTKSHNIRVDYNTRTGQPSLTQLDPWVDRTNPLMISFGNANLKPSFTHSLDVRYNLNNRAKMRTLMVRLRGSMAQNSIVSKSTFDTAGIQQRTYDNVNGVWSLSSDVTVNFPINTSFQLNSSSRVQLNQNVSLNNGLKNKTQYNRYIPNLGLQFSTLFMDLGLSGTVTFTNTKNSLASKNDQNIRDYDVNAWTTVYLPLSFTFVSDVSFKSGSGYAAGYDVSQVVWNAGIEKSIMKNKGTIKFSVNDILRDKKNISYSATDNYIQQSLTNTLNCYFMVSFTYRFNVFGGQSVSGSSSMGGPGGGMMMRR
ncbi:MAG: outer membrane beta-barrel protein [Prevotellaceae bacterium]|jgi:hypothetical protein|nr:outer membrane beta-barrel protein [Prevotellaceae bacterium]